MGDVAFTIFSWQNGLSKKSVKNSIKRLCNSQTQTGKSLFQLFRMQVEYWFPYKLKPSLQENRAIRPFERILTKPFGKAFFKDGQYRIPVQLDKFNLVYFFLSKLVTYVFLCENLFVKNPKWMDPNCNWCALKQELCCWKEIQEVRQIDGLLSTPTKTAIHWDHTSSSFWVAFLIDQFGKKNYTKWHHPIVTLFLWNMNKFE